MSIYPPSRPTTPLGGRYALREPLGEGSFAVTYLAEDLVLGRLVAVKVLRARYGSDPAAAARFGREARAAASVSSPYIVDVFDYGTDQGSSYIVLQYVAGPTLRDRIDQAGRVAPHDAVRIAIEVLRGLAVIHNAGIIHRDVKPHNVLLDRDGTARVTDFGVALWSGMETLTSHGMAVGTAVYMAPEQAQGTDVTEAADLYAVGVLLFEMLTGQPPFRADNPTALMLAHVRQSPPLPTDIVPGLLVPVAVEREVMRALAKEPRDRRLSAQEMALALEAAAAGIGAPRSNDASSSFQGATTASLPVLASRAAAARGEATSVSAPARQSPSVRSRAWLGPLALVVAALAILGIITMSGGFSGLAGLLAPAGEDNIAGVGDETPTAAATLQAQPVPTLEPSTVDTPEPDLAITNAQSPGQSLFPVLQTPAPGQEPTATVSNPAAAPVTSTPTPPPAPPPTEAVDSIAIPPADEPMEQGDEREEPDEGSAEFADPDGSMLQFGPGDWQGAAPADASIGRPAVALYGAEGASARAVLQFELASAPTGRMILTLTGLGDESGLAFPFGIEVNGMYIGQSPKTFANWHPARDGINGEQASWDQVRINLPPEVFQAGLNEIAIVSLAPGDYDDRVPYLLLSDATLNPE